MSPRDARQITRIRLTAPALMAVAICCSGCLCPGTMPGGCLPYASAPLANACDDCGGMCGGACMATGAASGPAVAAFPASCGTRAVGGCGGLSGLMLPLLSTRLACGSGCGDVYWGEWLCDPPECCDACNDDGCWAGTAGMAPYGGYGGGCLQGILAGPATVIQGTYLGVTSLLQGTCSTVQAGCRYGMGYGYGYPTGAAGCDCADCSPGIAAPACSSCGRDGCGGTCVQSRRPAATPIATRALGTGVAQRHAARPAAHSLPAAKPPHRLVAKRLRR
jgi:hypothetical protein